MGSASAMSSIQRVLDDHEAELVQEFREQVPQEIAHLLSGVWLEGEIYGVRVFWQIKTFLQEPLFKELEGPEIDIDALAERYPCCEVGY